MNTQSAVSFPAVDTVMNSLVVGGMLVACALVAVAQGVQSVLA